MPHSSYNLVRVGMLLYGSFPSDEVPRDLPIKPVMEFKGPVVSLRKVKKTKGQSIRFDKNIENHCTVTHFTQKY